MPVKDPADSSVPHCEIALGVHCEPTDLFTVWWDMLHMHFSGHRGQEESSLKIVNFFSKSKKLFDSENDKKRSPKNRVRAA